MTRVIRALVRFVALVVAIATGTFVALWARDVVDALRAFRALSLLMGAVTRPPE